MKLDVQSALEWCLSKGQEILAEKDKIKDKGIIWRGKYDRFMSEIRYLHEAVKGGKLKQIDEELDLYAPVPRIEP